jgi:hypothetical protein
MGTKKTTLSVAMLAIAAATIFGAVAVSQQNVAAAQISPAQGNIVVQQKTALSGPDPLPGHQGHQAVIVLPPRNDGRVWDGDITWVASKNIEIVVLHSYNSKGVDARHGEPLNAPFGKGKVAITLYNDPSNSPVPSGSTHFTGTALVFHNIRGEPFTVTYTVKATAYPLRG